MSDTALLTEEDFSDYARSNFAAEEATAMILQGVQVWWKSVGDIHRKDYLMWLVKKSIKRTASGHLWDNYLLRS